VNVCKDLIERGRTEEVVEILSKVISAQPQVTEARAMLSKCIATLNEEAQQQRSRARQRAVVTGVMGFTTPKSDLLQAARGTHRIYRCIPSERQTHYGVPRMW
jgi:hypothetical protein